ncbi:MAG: SMC-Scp complex subunit ScpB [Clostridiales bacterium]|jgi:segregation and condensation protein B|nr:SMC-Scp complex subunit ScpB [Clostridiales bacterium]
MEIIEYECIIEALLFVSDAPVTAEQLAAASGLDADSARAAADGLAERYASANRGILITEADGAYRMCTNPRYFENIKKVYKVQKKTLTLALLETLAIIAFRQPVTKAQIEDIRGVNADHAVYKLMEYGLITERGRQDTPGKPILFGTTDEFLRYFGYHSLEELPRPDRERESETFKKEASEEADAILNDSGFRFNTHPGKPK